MSSAGCFFVSYYLQSQLILFCSDVVMLEFRYQQASPINHFVNYLFIPTEKVLTPYWFETHLY